MVPSIAMASEPSYTAKQECLHCHVVTPMRLLGEVSDTVTDRPKDGPPFEHGTIYEIVSCLNCDGVTISSGRWHEMMEREDWSGSVIYPAERAPIEGLPDAIARELRAAERVASVSPNAYAVLLGRVLDLVCTDRNAAGNTLHERLSDLANRQEIPKHLADMAHKLRQLRNVGAHADLGELDKDQVPVLAALCRAVLEYVYAAPRMVDHVEQLLRKVRA